MQGEITAKGLIVGGIIGQRGAPGNGIVSITLTGSSGLEDTYTILYTNGDTDTFVVTNGATGNGIASITKTSSVGLVDTYTILYTNGSSDTIEVHNGEKGDKGDTGATGATPNLTIGSVTKGADASATITGTTDNPVLNLVLPKGDKGDKGDTGNTGATGVGIYSITKTGTADLVDTYTILYTNGDTQTYTITNGAKGDTGATGNGISTITKTGTAGLVDTYTITFTDGTTTTFDVTNGADGNVTDVQVEGTSVVDNGVANITGLATQEELDYYKTIYNVLPKVNGNGESITLDNTGESILKLDLKGNTSQYSTTGINLFDKLTGGTYSGITLTQNDDGSFILNGTSDASNFKQFAFENDIVIPSGSYSLYVEANKGISTNSLNISLYDTSNNQVCNKDYNDVSNLKDVINFSVNAETTIRGFRSWIGNTYTANNIKIKCMLVSGTYTTSTIPSYEEYTGGIPAPNPSYPYLINEASGDNEVVVCGKNWLSVPFTQFTTNTLRTELPNFIPGTYTFSFDMSVVQNDQLTAYKIVNGTRTQIAVIYNANILTFTLDEVSTLQLEIYKSGLTLSEVSNAMIEIGSSRTTYEVYKGLDTYELDLGVENLLDTLASDTKSGGVSYSQNLKSVVVDFSNSQDEYFKICNIETPTTKDYVLSFSVSGIVNNETIKYTMWGGGGSPVQTLTNGRNYVLIPKGTSPSNSRLIFDDNNRTGDLTSIVTFSDFQLEEGTKANSYSPFGQTPIKMRGIGTYEDYFVRVGENNLFEGKYKNNVNDLVAGRDLTNTEINLNLTSAVGKTLFTTGGYFKKGTYTLTNYGKTYISFNRIAIAGTTCVTSSAHLRNSYTWTQAVDGYTYFGFEGDLSATDYTDTPVSDELILIINEGSTPLPFGSGKWYKYNAIEEEVLDGSEDWIASGSQPQNGLKVYYKSNIQGIDLSSNPDLIYCNILDGITVSQYNNAIKQGVASNLSGTAVFDVCLLNTSMTLATWETFLGGTNMIVDIPLSNPYLSLVENETLISQLDKVEKALSKDGQTNISQVNNDIPFKIYASALMKISGE